MPAFTFTKMFVADLDSEAAFYEQVIGLKIVMRMTVGEGDSIADEVLLSADGTLGGGASLALLRYRERPAPPVGELMLGFMVEDVDGVAALAERAGGRILHAPHDIPEHGVRVTFVADAEGHEMEIIQPLAR